MAANIVHFGPDTTFRLPVFESAGYAVRECCSVGEFQALLSSPEPPDVIVVTEAESLATKTAVTLARLRPAALCVFFPSEIKDDIRGELQDDAASRFDLVVPACTPPGQWLGEVAALVEESRKLRERSRELMVQSAQLCEELFEARQKLRGERERSRREREGTPREPSWNAPFTEASLLSAPEKDKAAEPD
jgi:hypothetical protein